MEIVLLIILTAILTYIGFKATLFVIKFIVEHWED